MFKKNARSRRVRLPDRSRIVVRPIAPEDAEALAAFIVGLAPETRFMRAIGPGHVAYLTGVDHNRHEQLVAIDPLSGRFVGLASYAVLGHSNKADVAIVVSDAWHRRGVAKALLDRLTRQARETGVRRFTALVDVDNDVVNSWLRRMGAERIETLGQQSDWVIDIGEPARRWFRRLHRAAGLDRGRA
jgi:acetyltransferase